MERNERENRIKKLLRKTIALVVLMAFMIPPFSPQVFADTSVIISGGDQAKGGDTFTVAVTFGDGSVGRVDAQLLYDTDMLTYVSGGSSSGNTGYIQLKNAGTEGSITFNIEFQAITEGDTVLEVTTNELYDLDEMMLDNPSASKTISISGDAEEEALITETTSPDEPVETTELVGVDELPEGDAAEENGTKASAGINLIFIVIAALLVILIIVISVILASKKKRSKLAAPKAPVSPERGNRYDRLDVDDEYRRYDRQSEYHQVPRVGRSGMILDQEPIYDRERSDIYDEDGYGADAYDREEYDRIEQEVIRKRAREETAVWNNWDLGDDDPDDIEKW